MKLSHPDSGQVIDVDPGREDMYESQGWARTPVKEKTAASVVVKPVEAGTVEKEKANGH